jgi:multidrug resistance efflux pump
MDIRRSLLASFILVLPALLQGADVYRTVDDEGNVTYTDTPVKAGNKIEKIEIQPGPSAESRLDTEKRNAAIRKAMEEARSKRLEKETSKQDRLSKARKELEAAEADLKRTKQIGDDDRQSLSGGRSRITPAYFERVKEAEKKVEEARKNLKETRGY